jgi:hypothetical protein
MAIGNAAIKPPHIKSDIIKSIITIFTDIIMSAAAPVWFLIGIPIGASGASGLSVIAGRSHESKSIKKPRQSGVFNFVSIHDADQAH